MNNVGNFDDLVKGLKEVDEDFVKFIFSLDRTIYIDDERVQKARTKANQFSQKSKRDHKEFVNIAKDFFKLNSSEVKKINEDLNSDNFRDVVSFILNKKFDFEFEREQLVETLELSDEANTDFSDQFHCIATPDKNPSIFKYFIFRIDSRNKQTGFKGQIPKYGDTYHYHLVKYDKKNKTIEIKGAKRGYKKIVNFIGKEHVGYEVDYDIEKDVLTENFLLSIFKSINFNIVGVEYNETRKINLKAYSTKYDLDFIINNLVLLTDKVDLFNFKRFMFIYRDSKIKSIEGTLELRIRPNEGYYELVILPKSNSDKKKIIEEKFENIFNIQIGKKYALDNSYYLKKMFTGKRSFWLKRIKERKELDMSLKIMVDNNIVKETKKSVRIDTNKLSEYLSGLLRKLTSFKDNSFSIEEVLLDNKSIVIYGFFTELKTSYKKLFSCSISFDDDKNSILHFSNLDWYKIFSCNTDEEKGKKELLDYFNKKVKFYTILSKSLVNKRSIDAYNLLKERKDNLNLNKDGAVRGKIVETSVNNILEGLFPNHIPVGGNENPDGLLYLCKILNIVDSKSKDKIESKDVDAIIRYVNDSYFDKDILEINEQNGILLFDDLMISSLNEKTLETRSKKEKVEISYLSMSLLLDFFFFVRQHIDEIYIDTSLLEKILNKFAELVVNNRISNLGLDKTLDKIRSNEEKFVVSLKSLITKSTTDVNELNKDK